MHKGLMRHGKAFGQFDVEYVGTDYFIFYHRPCRDKKLANNGHCLPKFLLLDSDGRIVFHLKCLDCQHEDALKTHFEMWQVNREKHYETKIFLEKKLVHNARLTRASTRPSKTSPIGFDYLKCKNKDV